MSHLRARRLVFALAAAGAAVACGGEGPSTGRAAVSVTDSAGIHIASFPDSPFRDTASLSGAQTIGVEGSPDYEFFRVRHVAALGSGNVVVANGGTSELMFYDSAGAFQRRVGRRGEGPAEFGFLTTVLLRPGDSLAVLDPRRRRLVVFDSAGRFARGESFGESLTREPPPGACFFPGLLGLLADGTRLTRGWGCMSLIGSAGERPTMMTLALAHGERRDTLGRFNSNTVWERSGAAAGPDAFAMIPFGSVMSWATGTDHVFISEGRDFSVSVYDARGRLVEIVREEGEPAEVSPADRDRYREERAAMDAPLFDDVPFAERFARTRD